MREDEKRIPIIWIENVCNLDSRESIKRHIHTGWYWLSNLDRTVQEKADLIFYFIIQTINF